MSKNKGQRTGLNTIPNTVKKEHSFVSGPKLSKRKVYILESFNQHDLIDQYYTLDKDARMTVSGDMEFMEMDIVDLVSFKSKFLFANLFVRTITT
jgi:hypothetical protein